MALKTTSEMLEEVQAAISAALLGQSYTVNGQTVSRADLDKLQNMEKYYESKLSKENNANTQELGSFKHADI